MGSIDWAKGRSIDQPLALNVWQMTVVPQLVTIHTLTSWSGGRSVTIHTLIDWTTILKEKERFLHHSIGWAGGWPVPHPIQLVEPFFGSTIKIFNLKPFKQVWKTFDTRF